MSAEKTNQSFGGFFRKYNTIVVSIILIVALFVVGNIMTGGSFATPLATVKTASVIAFFGLGQMLIIGSGGNIDLSVGYNATLVACICAGIMDGQNSGLPLSILVAVGIGALVGLVNGLFSVCVGLPSLVVTLAMSQMLQGILDVFTSGHSIGGRPAPILNNLIAKSSGRFPNVVFLLVAVTVVAMLILYKTKIGNRLVACGANATAAHLSGVHVKRVQVLAFVACGIIAGLMGLVLMGNMNSAFKDMGSSYVMPCIAAVVVGGLSINGGHKNYIGVILGAIVLQTLSNLFISLGWGDAGRYVGYGAILFLMLVIYVREKVSR